MSEEERNRRLLRAWAKRRSVFAGNEKVWDGLAGGEADWDDEGRSVEGVKERHEVLGVVDSKARRSGLDQNEGVGERVGIGRQDADGSEAEAGGLFQRGIRRGVGAAGEDVEDGTFGEDGEGGAGRSVAANPVEGGVEGAGIEGGGEEGPVVDGSALVLESAGVHVECEGGKPGEEGGGREQAKGGDLGRKCEDDGARECREGEDEAVMSDASIEGDFGDEDEGEDGEGGGKGRKRQRTGEALEPSTKAGRLRPQRMARKATGARGRAALRGKKANHPRAAEAKARRTVAAKRRGREESRGRRQRARRKGLTARAAPRKSRRTWGRMASVPMTSLK